MHITIFWIGCCLITNVQRADSSWVHHKHLNVRFVRSETTHKTQNTTAPVALTHRGYPWTQGAPLLCSIPSDNMNISALRLGHLIVKLTQPSLRFSHQRASKALVFFFYLFLTLHVSDIFQYFTSFSIEGSQKMEGKKKTQWILFLTTINTNIIIVIIWYKSEFFSFLLRLLTSVYLWMT